MSSDLNYLLTLDVPEKLELIGVLWDSIDESTHPVAMPDALVAELDRRKAAAERDPSRLIPWETVRKRMGLSDG